MAEPARSRPLRLNRFFGLGCMALLLGVDVGTTRVKALVVNPDGEVLAEGDRRIGLSHPQSDWAEQDSEEWWRALVEVSGEVSARSSGDRISAMALSTQGGAQTPVDKRGNPLRPARAWMDQRARREAEELNDEVGKRVWFERTGKTMGPTNTASYPRWLEKHEPEVFVKTARFAETQDFLVHRLTGEWRIDVSSAAYCGAFNQVEKNWDAELTRTAHLEASQLSPVCGCGEPIACLTRDAAGELGLPRDTVVCSGAHDQTAAALGVGAVVPGRAMLSCGTAWVLYAVTDAYRPPTQMHPLLLCHAVPGLRCVLYAWAGCSVFDWFLNACCEADRRDAEATGKVLYDCLLGEPSDATPLLFLPHFYGSASDASARGAFLGLSLGHTRRDMVRAVAEGIAFEAHSKLDDLHRMGHEVERLTMLGGASRSPVWPRIVADILNRPVAVSGVADAAALGAALLAGRGSGIFKDWRFPPGDRPSERRIDPEPDAVRRYDRLYAVYRKAVEAVAAVSRSLS